MGFNNIRGKWEDNTTHKWMIVFIISAVITFIGGAILVNGAVYYVDGNTTWKSAICKITAATTQKIRWGHRAIFEVIYEKLTN